MTQHTNPYVNVEPRRPSRQLFDKHPSFTRDILDKVHQNTDDIKNRTYCLFGQVFDVKLLMLAGLVLLFVLSSGLTVVMWFTNAFDNAVFSNLAIVPNTASYEMWARPSPKPLVKLHIFNYTNVKEFESGDVDKLNVKDVGPYVYELSLERINDRFNGSTRVTYQEYRNYKFVPELSIGRKQNDQLIVPNVPLLSAAAVNKHSSFFTRMGLSALFNSLDAKPFLQLPAHRFIVGYEDNLYSLSKNYLKLQNQRPYDRFGLVASNIGIGSDLITINTGVQDIGKVTQIVNINGKTGLDHWSTEECNSLEGARDGTIFSPKVVRNKKPIKIYLKEMCRTLPLHFEREVRILNDKIPAYRYSMPVSVFDAPERTAANQCFCDLDSGECPPQGVFNATPCAFGAPAFISLPHFHNGDPKLRQGVTGLEEDFKTHETYLDLHPTMGFVMAGKTRLQFNIQVAKSFGISQLSRLDDGLMLPIAWLELTLDDKRLPEDVVGLIFQTTFTLESVELGLKYGSLLTAQVTLLAILIVLRNRWRDGISSSSRPTGIVV